MTTLPNFAAMPDLRAAIDGDGVRDIILEFLTSGGLTGGQLSRQEMDQIISKLPRLSEQQVVALGHKESVCPICFISLMDLLAEEETAIAMDSPAHPVEELGVTRLAEPHQCNHLFCRRDISRWVSDGHDSCPACRRPLLAPRDLANPANEAPPADDAYDPSQLQSVLRHLETQGFGIEAGSESGLGGASSFPAFLFGPETYLANSSHNEDRSEYHGMYS